MNNTHLELDVHFQKERIVNMLTLSEQFFKSGCFTSDVKNTQQALVKIQTGLEMGLPPMEAMQSLYIVNGKVSLYGTALTKRLRENGWKISYKDTPKACEVTITKDKEEFSEKVDSTDPVIQKSRAYQFAPKEKLRWHCLGRLVRFHVPEILGGSIQYIKEEAEDFEPERKIVEIEAPERDFGKKFVKAIEEGMPKMEATIFKGQKTEKIIDSVSEAQTSITDELGY